MDTSMGKRSGFTAHPCSLAFFTSVISSDAIIVISSSSSSSFTIIRSSSKRENAQRVRLSCGSRFFTCCPAG
mgnify:CR=1 FL=1